MRTNKADIAVFFEGVYTPATSVAISVIAGRPVAAVVDIPYIGQCEELMLTTHTAVFYRFLEPHSTPTWPFPASALDEYKLAFHGEVTRVSVGRNGLNMVYRIEATDSSSYLNRMPTQFTWALIGQNYRENKEDYEFLGLPITGDDYATHWFKNEGMTRLMYSYAPRPLHYTGGTGIEDYSGAAAVSLDAFPTEDQHKANTREHYRALLAQYKNTKIIQLTSGREPTFNLVDIDTGIPVAFKPVNDTTFMTSATVYTAKENSSTTASGEKLNDAAMTCAANGYLSKGTELLVWDPSGTRSIRVRVNDRGPFELHSTSTGRGFQAYYPKLYHTTRGLDLTRGAMLQLMGKPTGEAKNITFQIVGVSK